MTAILTWERKSPRRWLLKATDGQIYAVVAPSPSILPRKNHFKATALGVERNQSSIRKYGCNHWTSGMGVAAAKRNIERWLMCYTHDSFVIAA